MVRGISSSEIVFTTPLFSFCLKYGLCVCVCKTHYIIKTHSKRPHSTKPSKNPLQRLFQTHDFSICFFFQGHGPKGQQPVPFGILGPLGSRDHILKASPAPRVLSQLLLALELSMVHMTPSWPVNVGPAGGEKTCWKTWFKPSRKWLHEYIIIILYIYTYVSTIYYVQ